jgi:sialate O-acetylesterase
MKRLLAVLLILLSALASARAASVSHIFGDHMVLQADAPLPVWGKGDPGEKVVVRLHGQEQSATVEASGRWQVQLAPIAAGGPYTMEVAASGTNSNIHDVLIGEVWLGAGQSNMAFAVARARDSVAEIATAKNDRVRVFMTKQVTSATPVDDVGGEWKVCSPETVGDFSAAGYFFARELQPALDRPVGVVVSAIGAAAAESFVRRESLSAEPRLQPLVKAADDRLALVDTARTEFDRAHAEWERKIRAEGKADVLQKPRTTTEAKALNEPRPTAILNDFQWASTISNGMIQPIAPYAIRGVLWYQGEHNAKRAEQYRTLLPALIADWRAMWKSESLPFVIVQLPNFGQREGSPDESAWAELREAQAMTAAEVPHTLLAVTIDLGEVDIHPSNKQGVGERLAQQALRHVYGCDVAADGPRFTEAKREAKVMRVRFDSKGLSVKGNTLCGFTIAAADRAFVNANAKLDSDGSVLVWSDAVAEPVAVRYAWADNPECNLVGPGQLPAAPFRTDDWPGITAGAAK